MNTPWPKSREVEKPKPHTIWKFDLPTRGRVTLQMPRSAVILSVGVQRREEDEVPVLWVNCDVDRPNASRVISVRITGKGTLGAVGTFIGTFQINRGEYVGHVFDLGETG